MGSAKWLPAQVSWRNSVGSTETTSQHRKTRAKQIDKDTK